MIISIRKNIINNYILWVLMTTRNLMKNFKYTEQNYSTNYKKYLIWLIFLCERSPTVDDIRVMVTLDMLKNKTHLYIKVFILFKICCHGWINKVIKVDMQIPRDARTLRKDNLFSHIPLCIQFVSQTKKHWKCRFSLS